MRTLEQHLRDFWALVQKSDGCWLWQGATAPSGYGAFRWFGRTRSTHRISFELANGPIPEGISVLHRCDVRACVRPDHLFGGTVADNNEDMFEKGRCARGNALRVGKRVKLTPEQVRSIRHERSNGATLKLLSERFGVSMGAVGSIVKGRTWKDV